MTGEQLAITVLQTQKRQRISQTVMSGCFVLAVLGSTEPVGPGGTHAARYFPELWNRTLLTYELLRCHFMRLMVLFRFGCRRIDHLRHQMFECGGGIAASAGVNRRRLNNRAAWRDKPVKTLTLW